MMLMMLMMLIVMRRRVLIMRLRMRILQVRMRRVFVEHHVRGGMLGVAVRHCALRSPPPSPAVVVTEVPLLLRPRIVPAPPAVLLARLVVRPGAALVARSPPRVAGHHRALGPRRGGGNRHPPGRLERAAAGCGHGRRRGAAIRRRGARRPIEVERLGPADRNVGLGLPVVVVVVVVVGIFVLVDLRNLRLLLLLVLLVLVLLLARSGRVRFPRRPPPAAGAETPRLVHPLVGAVRPRRPYPAERPAAACGDAVVGAAVRRRPHLPIVVVDPDLPSQRRR